MVTPGPRSGADRENAQAIRAQEIKAQETVETSSPDEVEPVGPRLTLVATPIGNLGDLSPRAEHVLVTADVVACEDTRVTRRLLTAKGLRAKRLIAVHAHNEASAAAGLVGLLDQGLHIALVTDAGTPSISDPGSLVVAAVAAAGYPIDCVPGPSALVVALAISGLPTDRFVFEGFLPRKGQDRRIRLEEIAAELRTVVLYEAPHRLAETISDLTVVLGGDRRVSISRELTKRFEQTWRGRIDEFTGPEPRGEYVIVIAGARPSEPIDVSDEAVQSALDVQRGSGLSNKAAVAAVALGLGIPRRRVYELAVRPT